MILQNTLGKFKSLVLVDELGRGANHEDGVSTAWSIIEKFIEGLNYVAVVTHYHQLTSLESMYPCCKNLHFRAQEIKEENQIVSLNPTFQLEVGPSHLTNELVFSLPSRCSCRKFLSKKQKAIRIEYSKSSGIW